MPKLKNFLQDLGSAVVPAAVSAGLTYASGGTINPATTPGFLALLGTVKAGAGGLAAREEEERQRHCWLLGGLEPGALPRTKKKSAGVSR